MNKEANDNWAYWIMLVLLLFIPFLVIKKNKHAQFVLENGQVTTCQVLDKYTLPASISNDISYRVVISFVWDEVKDTLDISTTRDSWTTVIPGGIYEMRYLANERITIQNCIVLFDNLVDVEINY